MYLYKYKQNPLHYMTTTTYRSGMWLASMGWNESDSLVDDDLKEQEKKKSDYATSLCPTRSKNCNDEKPRMSCMHASVSLG